MAVKYLSFIFAWTKITSRTTSITKTPSRTYYAFNIYIIVIWWYSPVVIKNMFDIVMMYLVQGFRAWQIILKWQNYKFKYVSFSRNIKDDLQTQLEFIHFYFIFKALFQNYIWQMYFVVVGYLMEKLN